MLVHHQESATRLEQREVTIGERRHGEVEILEGIEAGDLVVVHGLQMARDGQEVRLQGIVDNDTSIRALLEADR